MATELTTLVVSSVVVASIRFPAAFSTTLAELTVRSLTSRPEGVYRMAYRFPFFFAARDHTVVIAWLIFTPENFRRSWMPVVGREATGISFSAQRDRVISSGVAPVNLAVQSFFCK